MNDDEKDHGVKIIDEQQKRLGKFTIVTNHMRELWIRPLGSTAFTVWYILKSFCQGDGEITFPEVSQEDWAEYCGMGTPRFINAIKRLIECQLLEIIKPKERYEPYTYLLKEPPSQVPENIKNRVDGKIRVKNNDGEWTEEDRNWVKPFSNKCKFVDQIFSPAKNIFVTHRPNETLGGGPNETLGGGPNETLGHISITVNSNTDIKEVSKDTIIGLQDQSMISSQSSSRRKLSSNNPIPQKQTSPQDKNQSSSKEKHIIPGDWKKLAVDTWNRIPGVNHHTDMTTKTMERVSQYLDRMDQGTFFNLCHVDQGFMENNKIPHCWERDHKAFSHREILNAIRNFSLYFDEAYWPANKNTLPKSLDTFIYNPPNYWSKGGEIHKKKGSSFLLRCIANPNIQPMRVCKDFNPQYTQYFTKHDLLRYFEEGDLPNVYKGITAIENRVIRDKVFDFANGSTNPTLKRIIGAGPGKLEPMFEKYANYLAHEYNRLEPERMFGTYGYFQEFLEDLARNHNRDFKVRI